MIASALAGLLWTYYGAYVDFRSPAAKDLKPSRLLR